MDKYQAEFKLEGQFLGFELKDGYKIKYLRLATPEGEQWLELNKRLRASLLGYSFRPGDWIQVSGEQKIHPKTGELKLKPEKVTIAPPSSASNVERMAVTAKPPAARVLVCQKSDCSKRGSWQVCKALESTLSARGLADRVKIQKTGCMKNCKEGPNLAIVPAKKRYSRIGPREIPALIEKHFADLLPKNNPHPSEGDIDM